MTLLLACVVGLAMAAGLYLALSRDVLRCVLGLSIIGSGANLALLAAGRVVSVQPPIIAPGQTVLGEAAYALPQALVLTAIVIGFALVCFSLVLLVRLAQGGGDDALALRDAEPEPQDPVKPPYPAGPADGDDGRAAERTP